VALKDCIKELGVVSPADEALLTEYLAAGMTDEQAVQTLLIETSIDVLSIADRAREAGATINVPKDVIADVSNFMGARIKKLIKERAAIENTMSELNDQYKILSWEAEVFDLLLAQGKQLYDPVENMDPDEIRMRIGQVMFDENTRRALADGWNGFQGTTIEQIYDSWKQNATLRLKNRLALNALVPRWREIKAESTEMITGPREYFQDGGKDLDTVLAKAGVDQGNMFEMFGPAMYGDMGKMGAVTVKELFQNAYDAVQASIEMGEVTEGKIDVSISDDNRTVTITDNGRGMDLDIILNAFLKQAGTRKEAKRPAGGFGLAKMLFLLGNKRLQLETVRDGIKYTMDVTGTEVMASAQDPDAAPLEVHREKTNEPSGTKVTVEIADEYVDIKDGGLVKPVAAIEYNDVWQVVEGQILTDKITVTKNGSLTQASGAGFDTNKYYSLGRVKFGWGTADILIDKERRYQYDTNTLVMVEGLKQFEMRTVENPLEMNSPLIDRRYIINLHPEVEPKDPRYPFAHNRQGLKEHATSDLIKIQLIMATRHNADKVMETSKGYGTLRTISEQGEQGDLFGAHVVSEPIDISPDIPEASRRRGLTANEGDVVEVRDGVLYINGEEQPELTAEEFGGARFDVREAMIDQDLIPNDVPLLHNYQSFKSAEALADGPIEFEQHAGKDLIEVLYELHGAEAVNAYFSGIGDAFLRVRNLIAVKGNPERYAGMDKAGVGVSVLGKGYFGVHTRVPGLMMFINPGIDPKGPHIAEDTPLPERYKIIAASMMTTMVHEAAHYDQMNHGTEFIFALGDAFATTFEETEFIDGVRRDLQGVLDQGSEIYAYIGKALEGGALEITGQDLTELGQATTRDERGTGDVTGERDPGDTGPRADRTEAGRGDRDTAPELDDAGIREGHREGGVVAPRGAVHPDAGTDTEFFQGRKGVLTFDAEGRAIIKLFEASGFETFLHEAGHLYLELVKRLASRPEASEQMLKDSETLLRWFGIDSLDQIETKHHEKFAEGFEKYAMIGKAPSIGLQDAFNSYRTWLFEVYRKNAAIRDIELPDDIRQVMDRMLATDEEIALAEANMDYAPLYVTAEQMNVSEEVFQVYKQSIIRAHNDEVAKESSKLMAAMKRDQLEWWKDELKKEEDIARAEAEAERVYVALYMLQRNRLPNGESTGRAPMKLDRQSVLDVLNGDTVLLKQLPHTGAYGLYRRKGGTHVDVAAQSLGYQDGQEMLQDLLTAPPIETWIKVTAKQRMNLKYPDPFKDASMAGAAIKAVHSTQRAAIIAVEMRTLRKAMREDQKIVGATKRATARERREVRDAGKGQLPKRAEIQMFRRAAAEKIASMQIRDVRPHVWLRAERKAAAEAFRAYERNDLEAAYEAKRRQMINFEMYRAAVKIHDEMQKTQRYFSKFESKKVQQRLGKGGVLNQILGILEGTDMRKRSLTEVDFLEAMKELRDAVDEGKLIVAPEIIALVKSDLTNWQNLTVEQFRGLKEIVQQLEHMVDRTEYVYLNDEKIELDKIVDELEESILDVNDTVDLYGGKPPKGTRLKRVKDQAITSWLRPGTLARVLDKAGWGPFTKRFIVPIRRAYAEKYIPRIHAMQERLADTYIKHFTLKEIQQLHKPTIKVTGQNKKYTKADAIALALNQGNEGNKRAVLGSLVEGEQIFPQHIIDQLLGTLTANDWRFVQDIWDYYEEFWPDIAAAEERRRGIAPERVQAVPLTVRTSDGQTLTLRGGYHSLAYDPSLSDRVKQDEFADISEKMGLGVYVSASTRASATYERVKNHGLPVRLDLNVIDIHLRDVIRDIALGDEVNAIQRVINDKRFRSAMRKTGNLEALKQLNLWLTDAAVGESPANHVAVKTARYIRGGFVKAKLGLSATVALLQFTGFFQSMAVIGVATLSKGVGKLMSNPVYWWKYVSENSAFIKARYEIGAWNRDVQDVQSHIDSWFGVVPTIGKRTFNLLGAALFMPIKYAQKVVDISTWLGSYEQGTNEKSMGHDESVLYADSVVENAQTSGFFSDRSPLERGTLSENIRQAEYIRIWTTLIGYMLAKGNIAYEKGKLTNFRKPSEVLALSMDMVLLFTLEGMASALIYGNWPEDDDETGEKQTAKWVGEATVDSMVSGIPFLREIPNQRYGSGSTPIGAFAKDLLEVWDQAAQLEADEALIKTTIDVLGTAAHLPAAQTNRTLRAIWDEDETTPMEYLTGPRKRE